MFQSPDILTSLLHYLFLKRSLALNKTAAGSVEEDCTDHIAKLQCIINNTWKKREFKRHKNNKVEKIQSPGNSFSRTHTQL